eukprot:837191_1
MSDKQEHLQLPTSATTKFHPIKSNSCTTTDTPTATLMQSHHNGYSILRRVPNEENRKNTRRRDPMDHTIWNDSEKDLMRQWTIKSGLVFQEYILVDAGGGTVDIACYEIIDEFGVKEIVHPTCGKWGSCYINDGYYPTYSLLSGWMNSKQKHPMDLWR